VCYELDLVLCIVIIQAYLLFVTVLTSEYQRDVMSILAELY
jgi:hypothetical protein